MSITLTSLDVVRLRSAIRTMLSPLDFPHSDGWRSAVNRELKALLGADSAGFLLPHSGALNLYSDEHDAAALSRYPDLSPPTLSNGRTVYERVAQLGTATLEQVYGDSYDRYIHSAYYNEYAAPNGACDTLSLALPLSPEGPTALHFWHEHPDGKCFSARDAVLLGLALPALEAGVEMHRRLARHQADLLRMLDELGHPILMFNQLAQLVHETPAATAMVAQDPESACLLDAARHLVAGREPVHTVATARSMYRLRLGLYSERGEADLRIVFIDPVLPSRMSDAQIAARFGLTTSEIAVAWLIATHQTSRDIGEALGVSTHTIKRHTESIFRKLGVQRRAQVERILTRK